MHFSSFCTTNYVPLERFDIIYRTVSLKPLGFFFVCKKLKKIFLKVTLNSLHTTNILHSFSISGKSFYPGAGKLPNKIARQKQRA